MCLISLRTTSFQLFVPVNSLLTFWGCSIIKLGFVGFMEDCCCFWNAWKGDSLCLCPTFFFTKDINYVYITLALQPDGKAVSLDPSGS